MRSTGMGRGGRRTRTLGRAGAVYLPALPEDRGDRVEGALVIGVVLGPPDRQVLLDLGWVLRLDVAPNEELMTPGRRGVGSDRGIGTQRLDRLKEIVLEPLSATGGPPIGLLARKVCQGMGLQTSAVVEMAQRI